MILNKGQEEALKVAIQRYRDGEKFTTIAGPAGSGKSTLVRFIVEALPFKEEEICYCAYTGKACQVLLKKGNKNVSTLHKLLYKSVPRVDGTFMRTPKLYIGYKLIVADECSMIPKELVDLLLSHKVYVIFLGDNFQLPPVDKDCDNHLLDNPQAVLTEILRQAQESEIIQLSMKIRNQEPISFFEGNDVKILPQSELNTGMLTWADQIICATNKTRMYLNNHMRDILQRVGGPQDGDKVICTRNYWDYSAENEDPLVNGTIGFLSKVSQSYLNIPRWAGPPDGGRSIDVTRCIFTSDSGGVFGTLRMDTNMILTGENSIQWKTAYRMNKRSRGLLPLEFLYGYAITCHKSQGSQWPNVLVVEEKFPFDKVEHARWLYTAVTRAENKVVLIR